MATHENDRSEVNSDEAILSASELKMLLRGDIDAFLEQDETEPFDDETVERIINRSNDNLFIFHELTNDSIFEVMASGPLAALSAALRIKEIAQGDIDAFLDQDDAEPFDDETTYRIMTLGRAAARLNDPSEDVQPDELDEQGAIPGDEDIQKSDKYESDYLTEVAFGKGRDKPVGDPGSVEGPVRPQPTHRKRRRGRYQAAYGGAALSLTSVAVPLFLRGLSIDPEVPPMSCCMNCQSPLVIHQPDLNLPERLLGTCDRCGSWHLLDLDRSVMVLLPDAESIRSTQGQPHEVNSDDE